MPLRRAATTAGPGTGPRCTGWYLRRDETVAVDTDGEFYVLTAPSSLAARFARGAPRSRRDPPLVLGAGGKDGESLDLVDALARALRAR